AGTVDGLNLYGMVKNNPASLRDHAGLVGEDGNRKRKMRGHDGSDSDSDPGMRAVMIPSQAAHQHHASAQQGAVQAPPAGTSDAAPAAIPRVETPSAKLRTLKDRPRLIEVYDHFKTNGLIKQEENEGQRYFIDMSTRDARLAAYLPDEKSKDGGMRTVKTTRGTEYLNLDARIRDRLGSLGFRAENRGSQSNHRHYLQLPTGMTLDTYREEIVPLLAIRGPSVQANIFENVIKWWQGNPFEREALAREATKHFLEQRAARPYSQTAANQLKESQTSTRRARITAATAPAGAIAPGSQGNKAAPSAALQTSGSGLNAVPAPAARAIAMVGPQGRQSPVASTSAASHLAPSPQQQAPAEFSREWFEGIPLTPPAANVPQHLMHAYGTPQAFAQQFHAVPQGSFNNPSQAYYGGLPIPQQQQHPAAPAYGHQGPSPYIVNAQNVTINYHHGGAPAPFAPLMVAPDPTRMYDPGSVYPGQQMQNWPGQMMAHQAPMHAGYLPAPAPQADPSELPEDLAGIDLADLYQVGTHLSYRDYR
ncbi:hypothetical protein DXK93_30675, partial [Achromobacter sp. K91]|uniref:hypothetical protein n=1 Tax=Achromobacter sp. K91 TaxID=2292262 RepID=UPI000ED483B7